MEIDLGVSLYYLIFLYAFSIKQDFSTLLRVHDGCWHTTVMTEVCICLQNRNTPVAKYCLRKMTCQQHCINSAAGLILMVLNKEVRNGICLRILGHLFLEGEIVNIIEHAI